MIRFCRLFSLLFLLLAISPVAAQTDPPRPLDGVRATLEQIQKALQRADLSDAALQELRSRLEPLTENVQQALEEREPRLDAAKAQLEQLGPKPAANTPPETATITAERAEQQKQFDEIDAAIKRARLLLVQIDQTMDTIVSRRRAIFTRALFTRSFSVLSPELWFAAGKAIPGEARAIATVTSDWLSVLVARLQGWRLLGFLALTGFIAAFYFAAVRIERRVIFRDPHQHNPGDARKAIAALWTCAVTAALPIFVAMAFLALMRAFDLANSRMEPLMAALFDMVMRFSLTLAVTHALLAPNLSGWRLIAWSQTNVERARRLALWVVGILSIIKICEALGDIVVASLPVAILLRGVGAVTVALVLVAGLRRIAPSQSEDECLGPVVVPTRDLTIPLRAAAWGTAAVIIIAAVIGYVAFASFLTDQFVWIAFVGGMLFLLTQFAQHSIATGLQPQAAFGRTVGMNLGLRREAIDQISVVLSGLATLALIMAAAMLALAPWGIESNDMLSNVRAAFFGFKVGDVTVSLSSIIIAIVIFALGWAIARALQRWLDTSLLPQTQLDVGLRNSIKTSVGYIGFIIAFSLALGYLGLSFEKLAIVAGALSVGIGFGLQSIVNNFVSGLILLWERAIRVGDWVVVGDEQGYVRRINVRSTEIETFDRATMIVPNSNLVSGVVKNWVRNDRVGRIKNSVAVNIGADPEKVRDAMIACAHAHELVLKVPAPQVMFISMTDNMLKFDLVSFVEDVERAGRIKSDLNFAIFKSFGDAGLELLTTPLAPPPTMTGLDRAENLIARGAARREGE